MSLFPFLRLLLRCAPLLVVALFALFAPAAGCTSGESPTGGETHFLRTCEPSGSGCGSALTCLCGVCSLVCTSDSACEDFAGASCLAPSSAAGCGTETPSRVCEAACEGDADCGRLSTEHRCVTGVCRRVDAQTSGLGGASACGGPQVPANEVVILGDSFFATSHQTTAYLEDLARASAVLEPGYRYRDYSRLTMNALAWLSEGLVDQYEGARTDGSASIVVMNGGGADVLLGSCETVDASCPLLVEASAAFISLLQLFADDGVAAVVFVGYPNPVDTDVRAKMDALRPLLNDACANAPMPCHWVELRDVFAGHEAEYIDADGINPTAPGSEASATAIWQVMTRECIAQ